MRLTSADNFRDVAGPGAGYPTRQGTRLRRGVLYRSNDLQLTPAEVRSLSELGLRAVHDLRTRDEIDALPDAVIPGASWHHFDVTGVPLDDAIGLPDLAAAAALMERVYRGFVEDAYSREALGEFFHLLAATEGPQLFHCSTGKDRSGWVSVLLLNIAGVPDAVIREDYLLTNQYARSSLARYRTMVETALGRDLVPVYDRLLVADEQDLATAHLAVSRSYGSMRTYLNAGLGLDDDVLAQVAARLTA